jgi:hypothetical protein
MIKLALLFFLGLSLAEEVAESEKDGGKKCKDRDKRVFHVCLKRG